MEERSKWGPKDTEDYEKWQLYSHYKIKGGNSESIFNTALSYTPSPPLSFYSGPERLPYLSKVSEPHGLLTPSNIP